MDSALGGTIIIVMVTVFVAFYVFVRTVIDTLSRKKYWESIENVIYGTQDEGQSTHQKDLRGEYEKFFSYSGLREKTDLRFEGTKITFAELYQLQTENQRLYKRVYELEEQLDKYQNKQRG